MKNSGSTETKLVFAKGALGIFPLFWDFRRQFCQVQRRLSTIIPMAGGTAIVMITAVRGTTAIAALGDLFVWSLRNIAGIVHPAP